MLERQRHRLLREDPWSDATALSQELYAMFVDDLPLQVPGIETTAKNGIAPITVKDFSPDGDIPLMRINRGDQQFSLSIVNGQLDFSGPDGTGFAGGGGGGSAPATSSSAFPGVVSSYLGANSYEMTAYPNGRSKPSVTLTVTQLEGDPDFPHAVGRWATIMSEADGTYSMCIPVWG